MAAPVPSSVPPRSSSIQSLKPDGRRPAQKRLSPQEEKASSAAAALSQFPTPAEAYTSPQLIERIQPVVERTPPESSEQMNLATFYSMKMQSLIRDHDHETYQRIHAMVKKILTTIAESKDAEKMGSKLENQSKIENAIKEGIQEVTMERLTHSQEELKERAKVSAQLLTDLQNLKLSEQQNFKRRIEDYNEKLSKTSDEIFTIKIKHVLDDLNQLTGSASAKKIKLRDEFTEKWNAICSENYRLKWELEYIDTASQTLPKLIDLHERLQKTVGEVTIKKKDWLDKPDWTGMEKDIEKIEAIWKSTDEEMVNTEAMIRSFLGLLEDKAHRAEYLMGFAIHNDEVKDQVLQGLKNLIQEMNKRRKDHWNTLINRWDLICQEYKKLSLQVDHFITSFKWNHNTTKIISSTKEWTGGSYAPRSVNFDPGLRP